MTEPRTLTVVEINEWAVLFDGDALIDQGHDISIYRLEKAARGEAVKLNVVDAYDSPFEDQVSNAGDVPDSMKLSEVLPLTKRKPPRR